WRPKWMFSWQRLKSLLAYGWKILVSKLVQTAYTDIRKLIIGKWYTPADLAFYYKGDYFPYNVVKNVNTSIDSVLMPTLSHTQDDPVRLKEMMRRAIKVGTYLMVPLMFGMAAVAEPMVRLLLTEKWLPCVFYLRIFCYVYLFQPIQTTNLNAIKALGRSDIFLKLEIIKRAIGLVALLTTVFISVKAMAMSFLVTTLLAAFINAFPNRKFLDYAFREQIVDILPYLLMGAAMFAGVYPVIWLGLPDWQTLLIQVPLGAVIYVGLSLVFKVDSFFYVWNLAKSFLKRDKKTQPIREEEARQ
ncbi:MAG: oligosaccharide flippase family protein, partial [Oscillibacter sp.]|nr:oligosaccharide flippase family protein [Oscillibacter sp.]